MIIGRMTAQAGNRFTFLGALTPLRRRRQVDTLAPQCGSDWIGLGNNAAVQSPEATSTARRVLRRALPPHQASDDA